MSMRRTVAVSAATAACAALTVVAVPASAEASVIRICGVKSNGVLWCDNNAPTSVRNYPHTTDSWQVDTLRTTYSWFNCWAEGSLHAGGNHTWYKTTGDDNGASGFVPASAVHTTSSFDASPSAHGLRRC
ncbi:hypothetical protein [Streptomyces albidochromogenes]|uniref:Secreted protein n=1 Tax=Streptomyces albidochromogenes TaxID=329524 RepID=A0ABW6FEE4_9ACTN